MQSLKKITTSVIKNTLSPILTDISLRTSQECIVSKQNLFHEIIANYSPYNIEIGKITDTSIYSFAHYSANYFNNRKINNTRLFITDKSHNIYNENFKKIYKKIYINNSLYKYHKYDEICISPGSINFIEFKSLVDSLQGFHPFKIGFQLTPNKYTEEIIWYSLRNGLVKFDVSITDHKQLHYSMFK